MPCNCNTPSPCGNNCKVNSKDVCYTGIDLTCIDIFPSSHTVENYLIKIDEILCQLLNAANLNYGVLTLNANGVEVGTFAALGAVDTIFNINLDNIGLGAQVFKSYNALTDTHELRSITKTGDLIVVTENPDDIEFTIDEAELNNFIEANQKTYSIDNIGTGEGVYIVPDDIVGDNTDFNFKSLLLEDAENTGTTLVDGITSTADELSFKIKTLDTETLIFDTSVPGKLKIDIPSTSSLSDFIINHEFPVTYADWLKANTADNGGTPIIGYQYKGLGTLAKPYTNTHIFTLGNEFAPPLITPNTAVQNALDAYVGVTLDPLNPQFYGRRLKLQATINAHVFFGNLNYHGLKFNVQTGATLYHTPVATIGEDSWLVNLDHSIFTNLDTVFVNIELEPDGVIVTRNNGFKNKGTFLVTNNFAISKSISIINNGGTIYNDRTIEAGDTPGDFLMFNLNADGTAGYKNDGNALISCVGGKVNTRINQILKAGVQTSDFSDVVFGYGAINFAIDPNIIPFEFITGSYTRIEKCGFYMFGTGGPSKALFKLEGNGIALLIEPLVNGIAEALVEIDAHITDPNEDPSFTMYNGTNKDGFECTVTLVQVNFTGGRTARYRKIYFNNNYISRASVNEVEVDMTGGNFTGVVNYIGRPSDFNKQVMAFYPRFGSRAAAILGTMPLGSMFINTNGLPITPVDPSFKLDIVI